MKLRHLTLATLLFILCNQSACADCDQDALFAEKIMETIIDGKPFSETMELVNGADPTTPVMLIVPLAYQVADEIDDPGAFGRIIGDSCRAGEE